MESVGSNSVSSDPESSHRRQHLNPSQPITDRIYRALRNRLLLLHRSGPDFFVLGATGNVYTVVLSSTPSCTCPDRTIPCKHILFIMIRVLGLSLNDPCLRRRYIRSCQVHRLLQTPTLPESLAGASLRRSFHQLHNQTVQRTSFAEPNKHEVEKGTACPVCLEEMDKGENIVACKVCKNVIHEECWLKWKRSNGRRPKTCVICRARWRSDSTGQDKYMNLAAYVSPRVVDGGDEGLCGDE